ncbi:hypothetical protein C4588_08035 [Candidatus Parcubacteria bacterium]|nr:MAG: hypothetical protein C4588_08035 [Candidatus Parcubacteria bacterium]
MKQYSAHLITPQNVTIIFNEGNPVIINHSDSRWEKVLTALRLKNFDLLVGIVDRPSQIKQHTKGKFLVRDGVVVIENEELPIELSDKLLEFVDAKLETRPLENFWNNLKRNPSEESKRDLFRFMRANKMPITHSGCFVAYKKVNSNYYDFYTGKILNAPGKVIKFERDKVNPDRNQTCSYGLHVAAYEYANTHYHGGSGALLEVEVNPKDVVAVPPDYREQKMRVCRYRVLGNAGSEISDLIYNKKR